MHAWPAISFFRFKSLVHAGNILMTFRSLGNILIWFIPLPMALLAAMGFVAVFAGATICIIASIVLGIELFGLSAGLYIGLASVMAYFTSGMTGIYTSPMQQKWKHQVYHSLKNIIKF